MCQQKPLIGQSFIGHRHTPPVDEAVRGRKMTVILEKYRKLPFWGRNITVFLVILNRTSLCPPLMWLLFDVRLGSVMGCIRDREVWTSFKLHKKAGEKPETQTVKSIWSSLTLRIFTSAVHAQSDMQRTLYGCVTIFKNVYGIFNRRRQTVLSIQLLGKRLKLDQQNKARSIYHR